MSEESAKNDAKLGTSQLGVGDRSKPQLPGFLGKVIEGPACNKTPRPALEPLNNEQK